MLNRLKQYLDQSPDPEPAEEFFEVQSKFDTFYVSGEVGISVIAQLKRRWPPWWITFTDLSGAAVRVRSKLIDCVQESTRAQRQAGREFRRARRQEEKAERRPWEDDDRWL